MNCQHCGKARSLHKSVTWNCPLGTRHRTLGYTFYAKTTFEALDKPKRVTVPRTRNGELILALHIVRALPDLLKKSAIGAGHGGRRELEAYIREVTYSILYEDETGWCRWKQWALERGFKETE